MLGRGVSGRDLILLGGGLFLLAKATIEIHEKLEGVEGERSARVAPSFGAVIVQIMLLDIVFSLDSVITAVGMAESIAVMVIAVVLAVGIMMVSAGSVSEFVQRHPTVKVLALSFLLLIGMSLVGEGLGQHIPKGYIYFAMAFSVFVEMINLRVRKHGVPGRSARAVHARSAALTPVGPTRRRTPRRIMSPSVVHAGRRRGAILRPVDATGKRSITRRAARRRGRSWPPAGPGSNSPPPAPPGRARPPRPRSARRRRRRRPAATAAAPRRRRPARRPTAAPAGAQTRRLSEHLALQPTRRGAERHADGDLAGPLRHQERHQAVETEGGQADAGQADAAGHPGREALRRQADGDGVVERLHEHHRHARLHLGDGGPQRGVGRGSRGVADEQRDVADRMLRHRHEQERLGRRR